jgi:hypothetical protein
MQTIRQIAAHWNLSRASMLPWIFSRENAMADTSALQSAVTANSGAVTDMQTAVTGFRQQPEQHIIDECTKAINANTEMLRALKGPPEQVLTVKPAHKSTGFFGTKE